MTRGSEDNDDRPPNFTGPGRCAVHSVALYQSGDGYRCWACDDARIRARQTERATRGAAASEADELADLRAELERLQRVNRAHASEEGRLHLRIAQEQTTLAQIEAVCQRHGYDPDAGEPVSEWIAEKLTRCEVTK